jgi:hypothetical protein
VALSPTEAAAVLGVAPGADAEEIRAAFVAGIRLHHPDRAGDRSGERAAGIIEAYRVLGGTPTASAAAPVEEREPDRPPEPDPPAPSGGAGDDGAPPLARLDADTLLLAAPADEAFRWLVDAAHDLGAITYLDRSGPIFEALCRFEGEPATSLVVTIQGRAGGTEAFCTAESIEARPGPPVGAVVDLFELALRRRQRP